MIAAIIGRSHDDHPPALPASIEGTCGRLTSLIETPDPSEEGSGDNDNDNDTNGSSNDGGSGGDDNVRGGKSVPDGGGVRVGQPITHIKSKRRDIWIEDVFCYRIPAPLAPAGPNQNTSRIQHKRNLTPIVFNIVLSGRIASQTMEDDTDGGTNSFASLVHSSTNRSGAVNHTLEHKPAFIFKMVTKHLIWGLFCTTVAPACARCKTRIECRTKESKPISVYG